MDVDAIFSILAWIAVFVGFAWGFSRARRKPAESPEEESAE